MRSLEVEVLGAPTRTNHYSWGPLEQTGAQRNSKRALLETMGPLGPLHSGGHWPDSPVSKNPSYFYVSRVLKCVYAYHYSNKSDSECPIGLGRMHVGIPEYAYYQLI